MTIAKSEVARMSPARTSPSPSTSIRNRPGLFARERIRTPFRFRRKSVTSSRIPASDAYSCGTPSILAQVTAAPGTELSSVRRSELPSVIPLPRGSGSMANLPKSSLVSTTDIAGCGTAGAGGDSSKRASKSRSRSVIALRASCAALAHSRAKIPR
ncbi:MAG: hypothetical protein O3C69_01915 [Chloroflexi bacterium]|nr:hypothetical protein [Chloroflexota bacterium]